MKLADITAMERGCISPLLIVACFTPLKSDPARSLITPCDLGK